MSRSAIPVFAPTRCRPSRGHSRVKMPVGEREQVLDGLNEGRPPLTGILR